MSARGSDPRRGPLRDLGGVGDLAAEILADGAQGRPKIPRRLGVYELGKEIGRGGMGIVFRATHTQLGTPCAVKVLVAGAIASRVEIARFRREAAAVARMGKHPHIVAVHDFGSRGRTFYIVMELVQGEPLRARMKRLPYAWKEAAELIEKLARALHFAHLHGVIHRDVKPDNVVIGTDGEPQLTDFGLALDLMAEGRSTERRQLVGTPAYMSPEQASGKRIDSTSDIYSLGVVMHELLTGRPAHRGGTQEEMLDHVRNNVVLPPQISRADVPEPLARICLKCLKHRALSRYQTGEALAEDLARYRRGEPIELPQTVRLKEEDQEAKFAAAIGRMRADPDVVAEFRRRRPQEPPLRVRGRLGEGRMLGRYRIEYLLGRGGIGSVYVATQISLGRPVALKVLEGSFSKDPDLVERFEQGIQVLAELEHPHIVTILDRGRTGRTPFFVMELMRRGNLAQWMKTDDLAPVQRLVLVPGLCKGLEAAHAKGITHLGLKPENVLVGPKGHLKVADFGFARVARGVDATKRPPRNEGVAGTCAYMAPEQREDPSRADLRADLWSLGAILYELLTGELPSGEFVAPSSKVEVGTEVDEVIRSLLARDPAQRPAGARDVRKPIEKILRDARVW